MVSLYVCDFPQDLSIEDFSDIFNKFDGFLNARFAQDRKGQRIAFVDYREVDSARYAQQSCQGYRFHSSIKGINCRISDNSQRKYPGLTSRGQMNNAANNSNTYNSGGNSSSSHSDFATPPKRQNIFNQGNQQYQQQQLQQNSHMEQPRANPSYHQDLSQQQPQTQPPSQVKADNPSAMGGLDMSNLNLSAVQGLLMQLGDQTDPSIMQQVKTIQGLIDEMQPGSSAPKPMEQKPQEVSSQGQTSRDERPISQATQQLGSYSSLFDQGQASSRAASQSEQSEVPQYRPQQPQQLQQPASMKQEYAPPQQFAQPPQFYPQQTPQVQQQQPAPIQQPLQLQQPTAEQNIAQTLLQSLQSSDSINALTTLVETLKPLNQQQNQQQPVIQPKPQQQFSQGVVAPHYQQPATSSSTSSSDHKMNSIAQQFPNVMQYPKNATKTVYVEGLPHDTTEREIAHLFRPFPGFTQLRLVPRETKDGHKVHFCFADFESVDQTVIVVNTLQGYRYHKDDIIGLQFSFAVAGGHHYHRRQ